MFVIYRWRWLHEHRWSEIAPLILIRCLAWRAGPRGFTLGLANITLVPVVARARLLDVGFRSIRLASFKIQQPLSPFWSPHGPTVCTARRTILIEIPLCCVVMFVAAMVNADGMQVPKERGGFPTATMRVPSAVVVIHN